MSYLHDVFISYRRELQWTPWTRDYFKRQLESYLQPDLGRKSDIFLDERLEVGPDWVEGLGEHLGRSKVLVAVLSRDYFNSPWCVHELDLMIARMGGRVGLFVPVIVHDCDDLPDPIGRAQSYDLKEFHLTRMNEHGQTFEDFSRAVRGLSPHVAKLIGTAPPFDPGWIAASAKRFNDVYEAKTRGTSIKPDHYDPPASPPHATVPRLVL